MTPGSRRLLSAFLFALIVAAPIAALTPDAQSPTWPVDRPTRDHQEGDAVTILFRATNHQDGVTTYAASNLPPGLQINSATGLVEGTLTLSDPNQLNGSAGSREVTITATNAGGTSPYQFTWRVSRFRKGDVFAGIGGGQYRVFDENGVEKYTVQAETEAEWLASGVGWGVGTTTGCGYNWVSRKMYFTSFDVDNDPTVIEVDPVPAAGGEAFPRNRITTFRDSGLEKGEPATGRAIDSAPESVIFDGQGNMYVGHAGGYYNADWYPADANEKIVVDLDTATYYVDINGQPVLSNESPVPFPQGYSRTGVLEKWPGEPWPDNPVALIQWGRDIQRFAYSAATGQFTRDAIFDPYASWQGSDWIDLAADQRTIFYTSEWGAVHRYDVGAVPPAGGRQLDDYATLPPLGEGPHTLYALRVLPPGDGTGGVMVAGPLGLLRLSGDRVLQAYDAPGADAWFALNISPDGKSVWGASNDTGRIYKFDIASTRMLPIGSPAGLTGVFVGAAVSQVHEVTGAPTRYALDGLCVMGEYTAAQEVCGNLIDDDGDGEIDELCQAIEACTGLSPGDDDGDGLVDSNDPDCGAVNICAAEGFTDSSVAGYCARHNYEGDTNLPLPAPGPPSHQQIREVYTISGSPSLPPGVTFDANGVAIGSPLYTTVLNTEVPNTKVYRITFNVRRERTTDGSLVTTYQQSFDWTIENRNRPPVAGGHTLTTRPGTPVAVDVLLDDSDPDTEDALTITGNTSPANGVLSRIGNTFTYTSNTGFAGPDSFSYTISDGHGGTATATVSIDVVNRPPDAVDDAATTRPGQAVAIAVLTNDTDLDLDPLTVTGFTNPSNGTVTQSGATLTYTSVAGFAGDDAFTYTISDGYGGTDTATVRIAVVNRPPDAVNDVATTIAGFASAPIAVLENDTDLDNDALTITAFTQPAGGTAARDGNTFLYTPAGTFVGTDTFTYTISDGYGGVDTATVTVTVTNRPPVAVDDAATTRPATPVTVPVLGNDDDPDGHTITLASVAPASNGTVVMNAAGTVTYTSTAGFAGDDAFTYTISDGYGGTHTATVRVAVLNRPPDAVDDAATTRPGQAVAIAVLTNDTDLDLDPLTVTGFTNPSNGTVTQSGATLTYTSVAGFAGDDAFTYTISDGYGGTDTATVRIAVVNRPPDAVNDAAATIAGFASAPIAVLQNDTDLDNDALTITAFTQPSGGTVARDGNTFIYTPATSFVGVDAFTYTITDGYGGVDTATVALTVTNRPPVAIDDTATARGTTPVTVPVLANDGDPDGHAITLVSVTPPSNGTVVMNAAGTITYTANSGFQGIDTFSYTIRDFYGAQASALVTVTVRPPNRFDPCTCAAAKASPAEIWPPNHKRTEVVNVTNVVDPDGGPIAIRILGIYQDEPTNHLGDGETTIDAGGVGTSAAWVRAERTGNPNAADNGRVYEIVFEATSPDGSNCQGSVFTGVPHDQGRGSAIIDDGIRYDSTVAGGPIVREALQTEANLSDADVAARGFVQKYVAEARIGGPGAITEMQIGPSLAAPVSSGQFTWTSGEQVRFSLIRTARESTLVLISGRQLESVTYRVDCANGECNDLFLRAASTGEGRVTLSSLAINGRPLPDTLTIPIGGDPRSLRMTGLMADTGVVLTGLVKLEWTTPVPAGRDLNFSVMVGKACPPEGGTGGGGGLGTPPAARDDAYVTDEDTPLTVTGAGVLGNDLTFGGALSASIVEATTRGSLTLQANGTFTYTPEPNFHGTDTFRYKAVDGALESEPALVTITVNPVADLPIAAADGASTDENVPVTVNVLANDSDPMGGSLTIQSVTQPANGTAVVSGSGIVYTPASGFSGVNTFSYTVQGAEGSATAAVTVTVRNLNEAPAAVNDAYTTAEDTPLTIAAPGVTGNDTDPDAGDTLEALLVAQPEHGTLALNGAGGFTYTPAANYSGPDAFTYRVRDAGGLTSGTATVALTVTPVNDPPVAVDDSFAVVEDGVLQLAGPGVKANDTDADTAAESLTVTLATGAQRGSLTLNADGSLIYTPFPNVSGADTFTYRLSDGAGSSTAVVTIVITEAPDPPQAADDAATTPEDTPVTINVVQNDTDPDSGTLTLQNVTQAANGTVAIMSGQAVYTPNPNFNGQDVFSYVVTDGALTATAKVVVTVTPVNDQPVAAGDAYTTPQNTVLNVQTPGVLGNDSDVDQGQTLSAAIVSQPSNGTLVFQTQGAFSYTPNSGFTGSDSFAYRAGDGTGVSAPAIVTITVTAANQPPVAADDTYSTEKNTALTIAAPGILANDSDPDANDTITATLISGTAANTGTVTLNADGSFTFTPAADYTGTTTFRYRARDGQNVQSNEAIVSIAVTQGQTSGQVCYDGGPGRPHLRAVLDWQTLQNGDVTVRASVSRNYADNTYGVNRIGWGNRNRNFAAIYRSDYGQLAFYDANNGRRIEFRIDYLSPLPGTPSGYGSRGVSGGQQADGRMIAGNAADIVAMSTSMDLNMNAFGYVTTASNHPLKSYSPPTNASYATNATYPLWIWDVWFEATVRESTFGSAGFGYPRLTGLHASPAKEDVTNWRLINCQ